MYAYPCKQTSTFNALVPNSRLVQLMSITCICNTCARAHTQTCHGILEVAVKENQPHWSCDQSAVQKVSPTQEMRKTNLEVWEMRFDPVNFLFLKRSAIPDIIWWCNRFCDVICMIKHWPSLHSCGAFYVWLTILHIHICSFNVWQQSTSIHPMLQHYCMHHFVMCLTLLSSFVPTSVCAFLVFFYLRKCT